MKKRPVDRQLVEL